MFNISSTVRNFVRGWWWIPAIVVLVLGAIGIALGNGDDDPTWNPPADAVEPDGARNYFIIEYQGDVHEPNRFLVKAQSPPPPDWAGVIQARMLTMLVLNNVSVSTSRVDYSRRHFVQCDRQRKRNDAAESFVWEICSRTEEMWFENPTVSQDGTAVKADVFFRRGGVVVNLAEAMLEMGHAMPSPDGEEYDWGKPIVVLR